MKITSLDDYSRYDYTPYFRAETVDEAWEHWYKLLCAQNLTADSRDGAVVGEVLNAITVVDDPTRFIVRSPLRKMSMRYAVGELLWYASGQPTLKGIENFTKAWRRMSDDGETVNSNYGEKIQNYYGFNQLEYVEKCLEKDELSRQAVIHIKPAKDYIKSPTKDMPCTLTLQFFVRDGKLHLTVNMRSNDIWMGFPYDCFQFCLLQNYLAMKLSYKVGTYTHIAGSLHLYERNKQNG